MNEEDPRERDDALRKALEAAQARLKEHQAAIARNHELIIGRVELAGRLGPDEDLRVRLARLETLLLTLQTEIRALRRDLRRQRREGTS